MPRFAGPRPWFILGLAAGALFAIDRIADPRISVIALYGTLIVAALRNVGPRAVLALGILCGALTIASHLFDNSLDRAADFIDAAFGLIAICTTTVLTLRIDRSDRRARNAQADLAHVSRLLLADTMSTTMAHELNQPLAAAAANTQAALRWLAASPPNRTEADRALRRAVEAIDFAGMLVHRQRDRARRTAPVRQRLDLRRVIGEVSGLLDDRMRNESIDLRLAVSGDLAVCGEQVCLQQVLINLMSNAIEAMSDAAHPATLTIEGGAEPGWVIIRVSDVGCGLDPALREHLFEPFRTTKPDGLGMGLAISRSIVEAHGGSIRAEPHVPQGTVVSIRLPWASSDA